MGGGTPWGLVGGECMQWDAHHGVGAMHIIGGDAIGLGAGGCTRCGVMGHAVGWGMHTMGDARCGVSQEARGMHTMGYGGMYTMGDVHCGIRGLGDVCHGILAGGMHT